MSSASFRKSASMSSSAAAAASFKKAATTSSAPATVVIKSVEDRESVLLSKAIVNAALAIAAKEGPEKRAAIIAYDDYVASLDSDRDGAQVASIDFWNEDEAKELKWKTAAERYCKRHVASVRCTEDGDFDGISSKPSPRTAVVGKEAVLLHVWASRREARYFHEALRRIAQAKFEHMIPSPIHVPLAVLVAHQGAYVSVVWLPPLASHVPLPLRPGRSLRALWELLCAGLGLTSDVSLPLLPGSDGRFYAFAVPPVMAAGTQTVLRENGKPDPLPVTVRYEAIVAFPAWKLPTKDHAALEESVVTQMCRSVVDVVAQAVRPFGGVMSVNEAIADGLVTAEMHAVGLNVAMLPALLQFASELPASALPSEAAGPKVVQCVRAEIAVRALKAIVSEVMDTFKFVSYTLRPNLLAQLTLAVEDPMRKFLSDPLYFAEKILPVAKRHFTRSACSRFDMVLDFERGDIEECIRSIAEAVASKLGVKLTPASSRRAVQAIATRALRLSRRVLPRSFARELGWLPFAEPILKREGDALTTVSVFEPSETGAIPGLRAVFSPHLLLRTNHSLVTSSLSAMVSFGLRDLFLYAVAAGAERFKKRLVLSAKGLMQLHQGEGAKAFLPDRYSGAVISTAQAIMALIASSTPDTQVTLAHAATVQSAAEKPQAHLPRPGEPPKTPNTGFMYAAELVPSGIMPPREFLQSQEGVAATMHPDVGWRLADAALMTQLAMACFSDPDGAKPTAAAAAGQAILHASVSRVKACEAVTLPSLATSLPPALNFTLGAMADAAGALAERIVADPSSFARELCAQMRAWLRCYHAAANNITWPEDLARYLPVAAARIVRPPAIDSEDTLDMDRVVKANIAVVAARDLVRMVNADTAANGFDWRCMLCDVAVVLTDAQHNHMGFIAQAFKQKPSLTPAKLAGLLQVVEGLIDPGERGPTTVLFRPVPVLVPEQYAKLVAEGISAAGKTAIIAGECGRTTPTCVRVVDHSMVALRQIAEPWGRGAIAAHELMEMELIERKFFMREFDALIAEAIGGEEAQMRAEFEEWVEDERMFMFAEMSDVLTELRQNDTELRDRLQLRADAMNGAEELFADAGRALLACLETQEAGQRAMTEAGEARARAGAVAQSDFEGGCCRLAETVDATYAETWRSALSDLGEIVVSDEAARRCLSEQDEAHAWNEINAAISDSRAVDSLATAAVDAARVIWGEADDGFLQVLEGMEMDARHAVLRSEDTKWCEFMHTVDEVTEGVNVGRTEERQRADIVGQEAAERVEAELMFDYVSRRMDEFGEHVARPFATHWIERLAVHHNECGPAFAAMVADAAIELHRQVGDTLLAAAQSELHSAHQALAGSAAQAAAARPPPSDPPPPQVPQQDPPPVPQPLQQQHLQQQQIAILTAPVWMSQSPNRAGTRAAWELERATDELDLQEQLERSAWESDEVVRRSMIYRAWQNYREALSDAYAILVSGATAPRHVPQALPVPSSFTGDSLSPVRGPRVAAASGGTGSSTPSPQARRPGLDDADDDAAFADDLMELKRLWEKNHKAAVEQGMRAHVRRSVMMRPPPPSTGPSPKRAPQRGAPPPRGLEPLSRSAPQPRSKSVGGQPHRVPAQLQPGPSTSSGYPGSGGPRMRN